MKLEFKKIDHYSFIEVYGSEAVLNIALKEHFGTNVKDELYVCGGLLNSTEMANGTPIEFEEGCFFSYCKILKNGMLIAICQDKEGANETFWRVEPSNITKLC